MTTFTSVNLSTAKNNADVDDRFLLSRCDEKKIMTFAPLRRRFVLFPNELWKSLATINTRE